jgi:NADP-dependent 3-hydroxy acid dehydrogenase YdfG
VTVRPAPPLRTALVTGAFPVVCDVTRPDAVQAAAERIAVDFEGAPDVVVNNAGLFALRRLEETAPLDFARTIETNLVAPFLLLRAFLPTMRARGSGHVLTVGSIADRLAFPENGAYAASKFGARAMHEVVRAELRGTGVRATLVSPGPVDTGLWDPVDPDTRPGFTPRAAMLDAADVADAILYALTAPAAVNVDELRLSRS